ncbi:hypothetical protein [Streptomyces sp. TM32]|nr:hypothetical protein [Streptomyces sp. TM32]
MSNDNCWVCGEPGAKQERTLLGFKKPVCPPGKGCSNRPTKKKR